MLICDDEMIDSLIKKTSLNLSQTHFNQHDYISFSTYLPYLSTFCIWEKNPLPKLLRRNNFAALMESSVGIRIQAKFVSASQVAGHQGDGCGFFWVFLRDEFLEILEKNS